MQSKCNECFERRTDCIDQKLGKENVTIDRRPTLRQRVATVEALLSTLLGLPKTAQVENLEHLRLHYSEGHATSHQLGDDMGNLLHFLSGSVSTDKRVLLRSKPVANSGMTFDATVTPFPSGSTAPMPSLSVGKQQATRDALLVLFPQTTELMEYVRQDNSCPPEVRMNHPSLESFVTNTLAKGTPIEVATLLLHCSASFSRHLLHKSLTAVDNLIVGDGIYMRTVQGLQLSILLMKRYLDTGQFDKAWMVSRRGLLSAQLMGIHKTRHTPMQEQIWWTLYTIDQFNSLMLGLSYGIPDKHCDLSYNGRDLQTQADKPGGFIAGLAQLTGRINDWTQTPKESATFTLLQNLDGQLTDFGRKMPPQFWDASAFSNGLAQLESPEIQERIVGHMAYYKAKMVLHMHFMFKSTGRSGYGYSCNMCFHSARELLRLYHAVRRSDGQAFNCFDLAGFSASILICLRLLGYGFTGGCDNDVKQEAEDWKLIKRSMDIFQGAFPKDDGPAQQRHQTLQNLTRLRDGPSTDVGTTVSIPYFGTITVQQVQRLQPLNPTGTGKDSPSLLDLLGASPVESAVSPPQGAARDAVFVQLPPAPSWQYVYEDYEDRAVPCLPQKSHPQKSTGAAGGQECNLTGVPQMQADTYRTVFMDCVPSHVTY